MVSPARAQSQGVSSEDAVVTVVKPHGTSRSRGDWIHMKSAGR
jgi:hypothetical protein